MSGGLRSVVPLEVLLAGAGSVSYARFARDGAVTSANAPFRALFGRPVDDVPLTGLVVEAQREEVGRLLRGEELPGEARRVHFALGDGAPATLLVTWAWDGDELVLLGEAPTADLEAAQAALVKLNSRVSELARENAKKSAALERALEDLRQAQSMLVHREKMAALGQMTAGVAHELNNPLAYVKNNHYLLRQGVEDLLALINLLGEGLDAIEAAQPGLFESIMDRIEDIDLPRLGERLPGLMGSIDDGLERSIRLVQGLRTFSRLDEAEIKTIDLNDSLRSVVEFAGFLLKENDIELSADFDELNVPPVTCFPGQLNQAVLNILTNAVLACAPGGKVRLSTTMSGDEVLITIADNGPGVPEELVERIFEPFFTTREVGKGTGLGLSIAHTVVEAHGGRIAVEKAPEGGAAFIIHLPLEQGAAE